MDATNKFFVHQGEELLSETHWTSEQYKITLQASSEANLHTLKNAILNSATDRPSGYIPNSYTNTFLQNEADDCFHIHDDVVGAPTWTIPGNGSLVELFAYNTTAKTTANTITIKGNKAGNSYIGLLQLTIVAYTPNATYTLGVETTGTEPTDPDYMYIQAVDYDGGYASVVDTGTYETFSVLSEYKTSRPISGSYTEIDVTDIISQYYEKYVNRTITFLVCFNTDYTNDLDFGIYRNDSDDTIESTSFPYIKTTLDFTATGYPYWIGFTSQGKTTQSGPNIWMCELTLLASYEVT